MEHGARLHNSSKMESENDALLDQEDDDLSTALYKIQTLGNGIWYFLPAMSIQDLDYWFHYHSKQALVSVEQLPPNLSGFIQYLVLSQGQINRGGRFGCECRLETSLGETINITSFVGAEFGLFALNVDTTSIQMVSDHVLIWYDPHFCRKITETVKETKVVNDVNRTSYNPKLTFRFFMDETIYDEVAIKECGVRWIYQEEGEEIMSSSDFQSDHQEKPFFQQRI